MSARVGELGGFFLALEKFVRLDHDFPFARVWNGSGRPIKILRSPPLSVSVSVSQSPSPSPSQSPSPSPSPSCRKRQTTDSTQKIYLSRAFGQGLGRAPAGPPCRIPCGTGRVRLPPVEPQCAGACSAPPELQRFSHGRGRNRR
ncbi:MAG: hypothetical protein COT06_10805 [Syntrophobacteraceae bacterium CG07_land_8_20_14_0_80_61_8]|nr:MAG: hypothetical protein COT06_10805 [Syntrophobacteraceae bacterium CG07_land_8_20_14_0_80_61_8]